ncbi:MAG: chorismate synthase [Bacteroides sp.]|nr:MAG: chorismate synthase [Bacteroides sp.]
MASNSFGKIFRITTFGESHGTGIGLIVDGCPSGININVNAIQTDLNRRRPGQSTITTQRKEKDEIKVLSGIFENKTLGTPIALIIYNKDHKSEDYTHIKNIFRPSHADYTYDVKYNIRDYRGGGRSSARETLARVAGGSIAKMFIKQIYKNIKVNAFVSRVANIKINKNIHELDLSKIDDNIIRCPDQNISQLMIELIKKIKKTGDTVGGSITCVIENCPPGIGDPVFDKLHANLGKAMLTINAVHAFEYGSGFDGTYLKGSEHNDIFILNKEKNITTKTNNSGGIQGGITNGENIYFNVGFKPVATIIKSQKSIDNNNNVVDCIGKGRHDPCVLPRAVPIVESMTYLVLADHILLNKTVNIKNF